MAWISYTPCGTRSSLRTYTVPYTVQSAKNGSHCMLASLKVGGVASNLPATSLTSVGGPTHIVRPFAYRNGAGRSANFTRIACCLPAEAGSAPNAG